MPRAGSEPTTPVLERGKTVHALERAATAIGSLILLFSLNVSKENYRIKLDLYFNRCTGFFIRLLGM
jgi:hypothetical protein